jgi:hypothetical protein
MVNKLLSLSLLALAATGCTAVSHRTTYQVLINPGEASNVEAAIEAVDAWNAADKRISMVPVVSSCTDAADGQICIMWAGHSDEGLLGYTHGGGDGNRPEGGDKAEVSIFLDNAAAWYPGWRGSLSAIVSHELGHAVGLGHDPSASALMHYMLAWDQKPTPTCEDMKRFWVLRDGATDCK